MPLFPYNELFHNILHPVFDNFYNKYTKIHFYTYAFNKIMQIYNYKIYDYNRGNRGEGASFIRRRNENNSRVGAAAANWYLGMLHLSRYLIEKANLAEARR